MFERLADLETELEKLESQLSELYASGDRGALERAFGKAANGGAISLPGVMSRKKQVAPPLLAAFGQ